MNVGYVFHVNENECYFKLKIKENGDENYNLCVRFYSNVKSLQQSNRNYLVFGSDKLCLFDCDGYVLYIRNNYRGYQERNSSIYLYHTKTGCNKRSFSCDNTWNDNMNWVNHKSSSNEILFHLVKK